MWDDDFAWNLFRGPQNFLKHGRHKLPWKNEYVQKPAHTELVLIDDLAMYQSLFEQLTPIMTAFAMHKSLSHPSDFPIKIDTEGVKVEDLAGLSRADFFKEVLPRLGF